MFVSRIINRILDSGGESVYCRHCGRNGTAIEVERESGRIGIRCRYCSGLINEKRELTDEEKQVIQNQADSPW